MESDLHWIGQRAGIQAQGAQAAMAQSHKSPFKRRRSSHPLLDVYDDIWQESENTRVHDLPILRLAFSHTAVRTLVAHVVPFIGGPLASRLSTNTDVYVCTSSDEPERASHGDNAIPTQGLLLRPHRCVCAVGSRTTLGSLRRYTNVE